MSTLARIPYRGLDDFYDFGGWWDDLFAPPARTNANENRSWLPAMDITENETGYVVKTDLPGVDKDAIVVNVKDKVLTIEAKSTSEKVEKEGETVVRRERRSGAWRRSLRLGNEIDDAAISADYRDGVLTLVLPKGVEAASRSIDIAVH